MSESKLVIEAPEGLSEDAAHLWRWARSTFAQHGVEIVLGDPAGSIPMRERREVRSESPRV